MLQHLSLLAEFNAAPASTWAAAAAAAAAFPITLAAYGLYYRIASRHCGQQHIEIVDYGADTPRAYWLEGQRADQPVPATAQRPQRLRDEHRILDDLLVSDNSRFIQPLKIEGDLIVDGLAEFNAIVTVDGHVLIKGEARFMAGLLCKGDVIVEGRAHLGRHGEAGWWVARNTRCDHIQDQPMMASDMLSDKAQASATPASASAHPVKELSLVA